MPLKYCNLLYYLQRDSSPEKVMKEDQLNYNLKESVNAINNQINAIKLSVLSQETFLGVSSWNSKHTVIWAESPTSSS